MTADPLAWGYYAAAAPSGVGVINNVILLQANAVVQSTLATAFNIYEFGRGNAGFARRQQAIY